MNDHDQMMADAYGWDAQEDYGSAELEKRRSARKLAWMKDKYVSEYLTWTAGTVYDYFIASELEERTKDNGETYLTIMLGDRTGQIPARMWSASLKGTGIKDGDIVGVDGKLNLYQKKPQIIVNKLHVPVAGEVVPDISCFLKQSAVHPLVMLEQITAILEQHTDGDIRKLLAHVLTDKDIQPLLLKAPAAMKFHHAYLGGLLEHVLSMCGTAVALRSSYEFDLALVLAGCVLHDLGKVVELDPTRAIRYTRAGRLHGHVVIGFAMIYGLCAELKIDSDIEDRVLHLIGSHHGSKEYGATAEPQTIEAVVLSKIDSLDATLAAIRAAKELPPDEDGQFTAWIPSLRTRFLK